VDHSSFITQSIFQINFNLHTKLVQLTRIYRREPSRLHAERSSTGSFVYPRGVSDYRFCLFLLLLKFLDCERILRNESKPLCRLCLLVCIYISTTKLKQLPFCTFSSNVSRIHGTPYSKLLVGVIQTDKSRLHCVGTTSRGRTSVRISNKCYRCLLIHDRDLRLFVENIF
jgi:hypothetical protein